MGGGCYESIMTKRAKESPCFTNMVRRSVHLHSQFSLDKPLGLLVAYLVPNSPSNYACS